MCQGLGGKLVLGSRGLVAQLSSIGGRLFFQIWAPPVDGSGILVSRWRDLVDVFSDSLVFSHEAENLLHAVDTLQVETAPILHNLSEKDLVGSSGNDWARVVGCGLVNSSGLHEAYMTIPLDNL